LKQGTISVLFGCHSIIHSYYVVKAWRKIYGRFPKFYELCCILLHDIGHWGLDYLDHPDQKKTHWVLGARIAGYYFGPQGYSLCAGHCSSSPGSNSGLRLPDKVSWTLAPTIWLWWNALVEPKLKRPGMTAWQSAKAWKETVKQWLFDNPDLPSLHTVYLQQKQTKQ